MKANIRGRIGPARFRSRFVDLPSGAHLRRNGAAAGSSKVGGNRVASDGGIVAATASERSAADVALASPPSLEFGP